jgi:hypothetical protein
VRWNRTPRQCGQRRGASDERRDNESEHDDFGVEPRQKDLRR